MVGRFVSRRADVIGSAVCSLVPSGKAAWSSRALSTERR